MKKIMELLQNMRAKNEKKDNKGFSLVELIIVIAIMAILVGIVGTQVIPYINKSKAAKDQQVLNSISTAAVTAYSENADKIADTNDIVIDVFGAAATTEPAKSIQEGIITATGFTAVTGSTPKTSLQVFQEALTAEGKAEIKAVKVTFDQKNHKVTTEVEYNSGKTPKYPIKEVTATL